MSSALAHLNDLGDFIAASPSSFHAAAEGARRLSASGFQRQDETEAWDSSPGKHFLVRDGALIAWRIPLGAGPTTGFRIVGSHTDSPTFKLKPRPSIGSYGWQQIGVEVYGGPLLNSWLDRELGLAGRLVLADRTTRLVRTGPIMRIPQLAIHLDRGVNDEGLKLDKQQHTAPVWSVGRPDRDVLDHLAQLVGVDAKDVLGYDVVAFDTSAPAVFGPGDEFFASGRLDNLSSVHASLQALERASEGEHIEVVAAFDHEEIGSASRSGASGPVLADVLGRIASALGAGPDELHRGLARSYCLSADAGHAVHPNYPGRHDPANLPLLNGGPLLKINANQRYATDAVGAAVWRRACDTVGVAYQEFVSNNDLPCGSTIGPLTATRLGITTVDVGIPLLSMHSAREMAGTADPLALSLAIRAFFSGD
ncbi:M18 family aminopeptidase [Microlunatus panaciterrae]|uniref:M18 family aminopeptidase n=1 Tax=Microlunatus panaciterrae TaxID=400768 RepID=A0ABS2RIC6_9ACTN|nr:M18 family aminopeptidase [Microlunatus panaciterrae]MBM7797971.1 aspartyl aminopeptidase [Microlunatus panaciterrae]